MSVVSLSAEDWIEFNNWLDTGINKGWISKPVCATHEGLPATPEEEEEWDQGYDPCSTGVRIWVE